jgi:hypothetical protein
LGDGPERYNTIWTVNLNERQWVQLPLRFEGEILNLFIDPNGVLVIMLCEQMEYEKWKRCF